MTISTIMADILKKLPSIPSTQGLDVVTRAIIDPIKLIIEQGTGLDGKGGNDSWLSKSTLDGPTGILMDILSRGGAVNPAVSLDFATPPAPTGLDATGSFNNVFLSWDAPGYKNHAYTEVFRSSTDNLSTAVSNATVEVVNMFVDPVDDGTDHYYWIRFVSKAGAIGPFNGTAGTKGTTAADPSRVLASMQESISESHLTQSLLGRLDGTDASLTQLDSSVAIVETDISGINYSVTLVNDRVDDTDSSLATTNNNLSNTDAALAQTDGTVAAQQQSITSLTSNLDLVNAEYTFKLNAYGHVAGMGLAVVDGESGPESQVIFIMDKFALVIPGANADADPIIPFVVSVVNGVPTVGIDGQLVVKGSIHGDSIIADSITTDHIKAAVSLSAFSATMGTITGGLFKTSNYPQFRAEMGSGSYPFWMGNGSKTAANAKFYITSNGNAYFKGEVHATNGTFNGTLESVDGVFTGDVYVKKLVGDVLDILAYSAESAGTTPTTGYLSNDIDPEEYSSIALNGPSITGGVYTSWNTAETINISKEDFVRNAELSNFIYMMAVFKDTIVQIRILLDGSIVKTYEKRVNYNNISSIVDPKIAFNYLNLFDDFLTLELSVNVDHVISIQLRAKFVSGTTYTMPDIYIPTGIRKTSVYKKSSEGITYS